MSSDCSKFAWSENAGAYETQLARRCNNLYFPPELRSVSEEELAEARTIDDNDYKLVEERFTKLGEELRHLPPQMPYGELRPLRERIDDLIYFAMGVGGRAYEIAFKANKMRDALISDMREGFSKDQKSLKALEEADQFHKQNIRKFYVPVLAQMFRERSPIGKENTLPTILSENAETIALVMGILNEDTRLLFQRDGLLLLKEALDQGYLDPELEQKITSLGG